MLLVIGKFLPNVLGATVHLNNQARKTFLDLDIISTVNAVGCRHPDRLTGENPLLGHLYSSLM
jgi:hypothetical protein